MLGLHFYKHGMPDFLSEYSGLADMVILSIITYKIMASGSRLDQ